MKSLANRWRYFGLRLLLVLLPATCAWRGYAGEGVTNALALDPMLDRSGAIWKTGRDDFMAGYEWKGFRWESTDRKVARAADLPFSLFGLPIWEARVHFEEDKPNLLVFSLYNRGDAGDLDKGNFGALLQKAKAALDQWTGTTAKPVEEQFNTTGVKRQGLSWTAASGVARLLWSFSTKDAAGHLAYRSEYIRMEIAPAMAAGAGVGAAVPARQNASHAADTVSPAALKERVKKDAAGDVRIDGVPMIDQGQKGYCAAATAERVMRYYGIEVDEHEIAQIVSSSSIGGTDPRVMIDALKRVSVKLGCKIKVLDELDVDSFTKLVNQYNQLAKKNKKPVITLGRVIEVSFIYHAMDLDLLREARLKQQGDYRRYLAQIEQFVDEGIPLVWGVVVGKVPETPPLHGVGGHLRLIIGYNSKSGEVLYTDSWGAGHELKRMKMEDAWAITQGLFVIEPRWKTM